MKVDERESQVKSASARVARPIRRKKTKRLELRPANPDMVPLSYACDLLGRHGVPGYTNRESVRLRVMVDKALPSEKVGSRCFVSLRAVHALIGIQPIAENTPSEDQRLIKHYQEDASHDYVSAVSAGLCRSLTHAKRIYFDFLEAKINPVRTAAEAAKARAAASAAAMSKQCTGCKRAYGVAVEDNRRITSAIGDGEVIGILEDQSLWHFFGRHFCRPCWAWLADSPVQAMREHLATLRALPSSNPDPG